MAKHISSTVFYTVTRAIWGGCNPPPLNTLMTPSALQVLILAGTLEYDEGCTGVMRGLSFMNCHNNY